ncbi:MAG: hypothetical protein JXX29_00410 [Deltaproteobacteria bacterium]|nr:hypothetical protein [Deltaproteobacteria bacterium]MBN2670098.1 hypothetical protein [Deltaproteobacteria bacterium]
MAKVKAKHRKKYVILPVSLLVFEVLHEFVVYKARIIGDRHLRTIFLMAMFMCGFAFVGFVVAPWVERTVEKLVLSGKKGAGLLGELVIAVLFFVGLFYLYYAIYTSPAGIESILPKMLLNKGMTILP